MAFACYLDDSYTDGGSIVTLGGYFALTENWANYERETKLVYENHGIKILHATDLHETKGEFKGWTLTRKQELVQDLFILARSMDIIGTSYSMPRSITKLLKRDHKLAAQASELGLLFGAASAGVCGNEGLSANEGGRDVSFIVEAGNKNNAGILSNFNKQKQRPVDPAPRAKSLSFVKKEDCFAIQLADFWAFYSRRAASKMLQDDFEHEDDILAHYIDPVAASACARTRHTINLFRDTVARVAGHRHKSISEIQGYEFGPPPSDQSIASLTDQA